MRIKTVTLENIRSHIKSRINFEKGFNCLVGGLGTGKSSLLYAIDFAFFGDPLARSYHYLLREEGNAGKVAVEFLLNGKTYRIERGLKRRGKGIGQDVEQLKLYEEKESKGKLEREFEEHQMREKSFRTQLEETRKEIEKFDISKLENARNLHETASKQFHTIKTRLEPTEGRKKDASFRIEEFRERVVRTQQKMERVKKIEKLLETIDGIRDAYRGIQPRLRTELVRILERVVQQVLDSLVSEEGNALIVCIDETYTPSIKSQDGYEREVSYLSGGERTLIAFAYRFALGQLIMQARTGHGLQMLLLDEPTESLGREDRSVDRLAEAIARLKSIEQIIAVTHNEAFAGKAEYVIRLEKESDVSRIVAQE